MFEFPQQPRHPPKEHGFSLVEVSMAIGVLAFALISVVGLMPVGLRSLQDATEQARATNSLSLAAAAVRGQYPLTLSGTYSGYLPLDFLKSSDSGDFDILEDSSIRPASGAGMGRARLHLRVYPANDGVTPAKVYLTVAWPGTATYAVATSGTGGGWSKQMGYVESVVYISPTH